MSAHSTAFPSLPPPANPRARETAPPRSIDAGTPHDTAFVAQAKHELKERARLHALGQTTDDEVREARLRHRALELEYGEAMYPPNSQREQIRHQLRVLSGIHQRNVVTKELLARTRQDMAAFWETTANAHRASTCTSLHSLGIHVDPNEGEEAIQRGFDRIYGDSSASLASRQRNCTRRVNNRMTVKAIAARGGEDHDFVLNRFEKVIPGTGVGVLPRQRGAPKKLPLVAVGELIPSPPFPETFDSIGRMTQQDINDLIIVMNDSFGIQATDPLVVWQKKLRRVLTDHEYESQLIIID